MFALLVMPAASAQQLTARPVLSLTFSVALALVIAWVGLGISYFSTYPPGFWITTVGFVVYLAAVAGRAATERLIRGSPS
ncbi:MAG: metal ABC transporter permease [Acidimicrobiales bacterium]|nr:metal ABC transporter permease [Acidimicrobiales bacterium]